MNLDDIVLPATHGTTRPLEHPTWGAAFREPDPAGITLDTLTKAMAEITSARIEMWSALDDLEHYMWRDGRDLVVEHRAGAIVDATIHRWHHTDSPRIYMIDLQDGPWTWRS